MTPAGPGWVSQTWRHWSTASRKGLHQTTDIQLYGHTPHNIPFHAFFFETYGVDAAKTAGLLIHIHTHTHSFALGLSDSALSSLSLMHGCSGTFLHQRVVMRCPHTLALAINCCTISGSFLPLSSLSTPLETSTANGCMVPTASATLLGFRPAISSHRLLSSSS